VVIDVGLGKENTVQSSTTATGSELKPPDARTDFQTKLGGFFFSFVVFYLRKKNVTKIPIL
jgi:hypothetical protein